MYLKRNRYIGWGQNKSDGTKFQLTIDDVSCTKAEGTIIYVDIPEDYGSLVRTNGQKGISGKGRRKVV